MQTIINQFQSIKKASLVIILIACGQLVMAQSDTRTKRSTSVNQAVAIESLPSFDATITMDSSESKFILTVENPDKAKLLIRVFTYTHGELFRKDIKEELYRNRFDLGNAEDGSYYIEVSRGKETIRKQVDINTIVQTNRKIAIN